MNEPLKNKKFWIDDTDNRFSKEINKGICSTIPVCEIKDIKFAVELLKEDYIKMFNSKDSAYLIHKINETFENVIEIKKGELKMSMSPSEINDKFNVKCYDAYIIVDGIIQNTFVYKADDVNKIIKQLK